MTVVPVRAMSRRVAQNGLRLQPRCASMPAGFECSRRILQGSAEDGNPH